MTRTADMLLAASEKGLRSEESDLIIAAARDAGVRAEEVLWDDLTPADTPVLIRHTWDYHKRIDEFRAWLDALTEAGTTVHNSVPLVLWNLDKVYLGELANGGIATPRTLYFGEGEAVPSTADLRAGVGSDIVVIKPTVSATSWQTRLVELDDRAAVLDAVEQARGGTVRAMVQAYLPEIEAGEWSVVYIGGNFSHAVLKSPKSGEFRVQTDFGGSIELLDPPSDVAAAARRCIDWLPEAPTFARVDGVRTAEGFVLMELELIEPDLFLRLDPAAASRLVELVLAARG